jgi:hypothetical protein
MRVAPCPSPPSQSPQAAPAVPKHCHVAVRFKDADPAVVHADLRSVAQLLMPHEPWLTQDIAVAVISGGITNLLYKLSCGSEVRWSALAHCCNEYSTQQPPL